jgi:hypothetical protein
MLWVTGNLCPFCRIVSKTHDIGEATSQPGCFDVSIARVAQTNQPSSQPATSKPASSPREVLPRSPARSPLPAFNSRSIDHQTSQTHSAVSSQSRNQPRVYKSFEVHHQPLSINQSINQPKSKAQRFPKHTVRNNHKIVDGHPLIAFIREFL